MCFVNFHCILFLFKSSIFILLIYLTALGFLCCTWAFSSCGKWGLLSSCSAPASPCDGFFCCKAEALGIWASEAAAHKLQGTGSVVVAHWFSCPTCMWNLPERGSGPCPLHWWAGSLPLDHQGNPAFDFLKQIFTEIFRTLFPYTCCQKL